MTGRRWSFIAAKPFLPDGPDPFAAGLGGTEQAIINLAAALAASGDDVVVAGATERPRQLNGVDWRVYPPAGATVTVAINNARLLPPGALNPAIWFHNEVELGKEFRRGRLPALWRARPAAIFIGTEQARGASWLLPFRSRHVIPYGLGDAVLASAPAPEPPPPLALFTSQAYRGLKDIIAMWQAAIAPAIPAARLHAYIAAADVPTYAALATHPSITIAPRIANDAVLARLRETRVLLAPGHVSETFCLAAAEAIAMGVPVVTQGIGSLKERVRNGDTGFICGDMQEMAERTLALLTDDALWRRMQGLGVATRVGRAWRDVARTWQEASASF